MTSLRYEAPNNTDSDNATADKQGTRWEHPPPISPPHNGVTEVLAREAKQKKENLFYWCRGNIK